MTAGQSRRQLRPEIRQLLALPAIADRRSAFDPVPVTAEEIAHVVADLRATPLPATEKYPVAQVWDFAAGSGTPLRGYRPAVEGPLPVLVYLHGGGWVFGNLDTHDAPCRALADAARCIVVNVDYDLAPEQPFPGPFDNCVEVLAWIRDNAASFGGDPERVAVSGASAGGNLAAAIALDAVRNGGPSVVAQLLFYPVLDGTCGLPSYTENASGYNISAAEMAFYWNCYVPAGADRLDPRLSPLHAPDLSGLCPTLVFTGEFDPLRDEGEAYVERLSGAGVAAQARRYDGQIHGFASMASVTPDAGHCLAEAGAWLEEIFYS